MLKAGECLIHLMQVLSLLQRHRSIVSSFKPAATSLRVAANFNDPHRDFLEISTPRPWRPYRHQATCLWAVCRPGGTRRCPPSAWARLKIFERREKNVELPELSQGAEFQWPPCAWHGPHVKRMFKTKTQATHFMIISIDRDVHHFCRQFPPVSSEIAAIL